MKLSIIERWGPVWEGEDEGAGGAGDVGAGGASGTEADARLAANVAADAAAADKAAADKAVRDAATATADDDWRAGFAAELRDHPSIKKFDSGAESLAKSYVNLERMLGGDKVSVPKASDDSEGWDKVYKALGRPDEGAGYEFDAPKDAPDGFDYSKDSESWFRTAAHEAGLSQIQAQKLHDGFLSQAMDAHKTIGSAATEMRVAGDAELERLWGRATEEKIARAHRAMISLTDASFSEWLEKSGAGNHPALIQAFAGLSDRITEDGKLIGDARDTDAPGDIDSQISDFRRDNKDALNQDTHPDHKMRVAGLKSLYDKRHPEKAA